MHRANIDERKARKRKVETDEWELSQGNRRRLTWNIQSRRILYLFTIALLCCTIVCRITRQSFVNRFPILLFTRIISNVGIRRHPQMGLVNICNGGPEIPSQSICIPVHICRNSSFTFYLQRHRLCVHIYLLHSLFLYRDKPTRTGSLTYKKAFPQWAVNRQFCCF